MDVSAIIGKMFTFVLLLVLGYIFARLKITGKEFNKACSKLVMNLFLTAMILSAVLNKDMAMTGRELAFGTLMMFAMFAIVLAVGWFAPNALRMKDGDIAVRRLLVCYMNAAFIGYPIVTALYGADAVFYASISNIPFNLSLYTLGAWELQRMEGKSELKFRNILSIPLVSTLLAVAVFLTKLRVPLFIEDAVSTIASATVPMSMLVVGTSLGEVSIKDAFTDPLLYKLSAVRLLLIPVVVWLVLRNFVTDRVMLGTLVVLSATPSGVVVTPLSIEHGRDGIESSKGIFLSTLLSMLTIPLLVILLKL